MAQSVLASRRREGVYLSVAAVFTCRAKRSQHVSAKVQARRAKIVLPAVELGQMAIVHPPPLHCRRAHYICAENLQARLHCWQGKAQEPTRAKSQVASLQSTFQD